MQALSSAQQKALDLMPDIANAVKGGLGFHQLKAPAISDADHVIEEGLIKNGTPSDKLCGVMLKLYLRFQDHQSTEKDFVQDLETFIKADYKLSASGMYTIPARAQIVLSELNDDSWGIAASIHDTLSLTGNPYRPLANATAVWMAFFCSRAHQSWPKRSPLFDEMHAQFQAAEIAPFGNINIVEFGGFQRASSLRAANIEQLFQQFSLIHPADGHTVLDMSNDDRPVTLRNPGQFAAVGQNSYILARNVFSDGAIRPHEDKEKAFTELLCVMTNALKNGGRLYISNPKGGGLDLLEDKNILDFCRLKLKPVPSSIDSSKHSLSPETGEVSILEKDRMNTHPISSEQFEAFWREQKSWKVRTVKDQKPLTASIM